MSGRVQRDLRKAAKTAAEQTREQFVEPLTIITQYARGIEERVKTTEGIIAKLQIASNQGVYFRNRSFWWRVKWLFAGR